MRTRETAPPARVRPLRKDAIRNRDMLISAADVLISRRGLNVSLEEVARHAGVGLSTAYRHFPDRAELLEALCEQRMASLLETIGHAESFDDPVDALRWLLGQVGELQQNDRAVWELFRSNLGAAGARATWTALAPTVDDLIARGKAAGRLRADLDLADIPAMVWMLGAVTENAGAVRPDVWRRYLDLMLAGIAAPEPQGATLGVRALDEAELDAVMGEPRPHSSVRDVDLSPERL